MTAPPEDPGTDCRIGSTWKRSSRKSCCTRDVTGRIASPATLPTTDDAVELSPVRDEPCSGAEPVRRSEAICSSVSGGSEERLNWRRDRPPSVPTTCALMEYP